ncbi:uncharacterized protein AB9X84_001755 [Acanthopagrus schlegelii]
MGHREGVIAHLQKEAGRHIIPIHCMLHRALKVLLWHGLEKDIVTDDRQYSVALQHIEHLTCGINNSRSSRAGKDGNNTEGEFKGLHRPHPSPAEAAHGGSHQHWSGRTESQVW